ncbi:hypothetical protein G3567_13115 [Psychroflexus sp. YR1-1]|uniref:Uncharacterized protein n=2 Tax=Flavobacteriaceae TaxID=49546 RepID=A0A6B3R4X2_9FLAO|nr:MULTISPECIES: hypothetical protein [Flavobacteriaceae]MBD0833799.1 hypothetical protein [Aestuariibaculum sediminum]NEV95078.1 hypothetical protein [Psychroflexus aurantiacus]
MEIIVELIFRGLIVNVLGVYTRYYFFSLIGQKKSIEYLLGEKNRKDSSDIVSQHFFNVFIGLITLAIISFAIAYLVWGDWNN